MKPSRALLFCCLGAVAATNVFAAAASLNYSPAGVYASITGEGNNAAQPSWGATRSLYRRDYGTSTPWDIGIYKSSELTLSIRLTQNVFYRTCRKLLSDPYTIPESKNRTALYYAVGNFLARDISVYERDVNSGDTSGGYDYTNLMCSADFPDADLHPNLKSISNLKITKNTYSNLQTAFIDLSNVYGTSKDDSDSLRSFQKGELIILRKSLPLTYWNSTGNVKDWYNALRNCYTHRCAEFAKCEYDYITPAMVTLFVLAHNSRAKKLAAANPTWSDEIIFQESRRWMIAVWQKIVYYDFLPLFIDLPKMPDYVKYDSKLQPDLDLMFSAVTLKRLRTEFPTAFKAISFSPKSGLVENIVKNPLEDLMALQEFGGEAIFRGLVATPAGQRDSVYSPKLHYRYSHCESVRDFAVIDHYRVMKVLLPTYDYFRSYYGIGTKTSYPWTNFPNVFEPAGATTAQFLITHTFPGIISGYNSLDVYMGMNIEAVLPDRIVGPLFEKSALDQFDRLRHGDNFFFENPLSPAPFTTEQINEIKSTTIESLIFENFNVGRFPRNGLFPVYSYTDKVGRPDDYIFNHKCSTSFIFENEWSY